LLESANWIKEDETLRGEEGRRGVFDRLLWDFSVGGGNKTSGNPVKVNNKVKGRGTAAKYFENPNHCNSNPMLNSGGQV